MENDFPKLRPGMAITFKNNSSLGFMVSETQIMYVQPHNNYSVIVRGWDLLGDREYTSSVPYSRIKAVYATSDNYNETIELESLTPLRLALMEKAISNEEDPTNLVGVKLIWCRQKHKEMTVKDIEKALGYKIKIVGENGDEDNNKTI